METPSLTPKRLSKKDLMTGIGGSFLVHVLAFSVAFIGAWILPHKPIKPPFCTVNLVSLKDIGTGANEPKGSPNAPEQPAVSEAPKAQAKAVEKSGPAVPIKRLQLDETVRRPEAPIKKIEPKEAPKIAESPQSMASIEKNLDKLITKPKVMPKTSAPIEQVHESGPKPTAPEPAAGKPGRNVSENSTVQRGSPTGSSDAGAKGATQGSTAGSPEGSTAASALLNLYGQKVREAIEREWRLANDQGISGLKTVVEVQIRKSGEIINMQVVKTSGNAMFDQSAIRAVQRASLPAVPEFIVQSNTKLILTFIPGRVS